MLQTNSEAQDIQRHWREAVPNDRMAHLIRDIERAFRRALHRRLAEFGVPFGHWSFLRILWEADGLTQKELSRRAGVMEPTTFAAMKAMEALGYVTRRQLPTNKKNVYVHLTVAGRALKKQLVPLAEDSNRISIQNLEPEELAVARKVLLAMLFNLTQEAVAQDEKQAAQPTTRAARMAVGEPAARKRRSAAPPAK